MRLRRIIPQAWHLDALDKMDATRMRVYFEKKDDKEPDEQVSTRPLTSRLFDALFPSKR